MYTHSLHLALVGSSVAIERDTDAIRVLVLEGKGYPSPERNLSSEGGGDQGRQEEEKD